MLGVVAVVLAVLLAPAMRSYVAQRRQIDALTARVAAQRNEVVDLQRQRQAWDDPAYVKAQARDRLKFVMPGERAYTVIDPAPTARPPARQSGSSVAAFIASVVEWVRPTALTSVPRTAATPARASAMRAIESRK